MSAENPFPFPELKTGQDGVAGAAKRVCDFLFAAGALVLLSPLLLIVMIAIRFSMGSPVIFRQLRPGWREKIFTLYKFRTMSESRGQDGKPLPDEQRLTRLGRFNRGLSLDELPQLWNVLKGDLSLVGPRPLLIEYLARYEPWQRKRHLVRPGITGWAQVNGRNELSWEGKFRHDVFYAENWSLGLDFKILFHTIWIVMKREGISQPGEATMEEFMGAADRSLEK